MGHVCELPCPRRHCLHTRAAPLRPPSAPLLRVPLIPPYTHRVTDCRPSSCAAAGACARSSISTSFPAFSTIMENLTSVTDLQTESGVYGGITFIDTNAL